MLRYIGNYDFGGHTAKRVIRLPVSTGSELAAGIQFNFAVRKRVAREDGDEHLFDFHTILVKSDGTIDEYLASLSAREYSLDGDPNPTIEAAFRKLDSTLLESAFGVAKSHLESQTKLWDWDEEVDLIGVAKVFFVPATS